MSGQSMKPHAIRFEPIVVRRQTWNIRLHSGQHVNETRIVVYTKRFAWFRVMERNWPYSRRTVIKANSMVDT